MTIPTSKVAHNLELFQALRSLAFAETQDLREGRMFGAPAIFIGRRMAVCVLGEEVGLRVPADTASTARLSGRARAFMPYGKHPMREWIALDLTAEELSRASDLIAVAIQFAKANNDG